MEEVDCLIKALADHINKDLLAGKLYEQEVAEETKALAELISARAKFPITDGEIKKCNKKGENMSEVEELKELCQPVVDWLKKNYSPHTEVHITAEHIDLMESMIGIPVK